jgi:tripartite-type tricarboxylate transporter receptor subunit TctC
MFDNLPASIEHVRLGKLRALAVTTLQRSDMLPEVPTVAETVPGFDVSVWNTMVAPKGTPQNVIDALNRAINDLLQSPRAKARFTELGGTPMPMTPADLGKLFVSEEEKWRKVIRAANIKPE